MKELKDYLHLYLGCQVVFYDGRILELTGINNSCFYVNGIRWPETLTDHGKIKPILRLLSDISKKERKELAAIAGLDFDNEITIWTPDQFVWLLSKHFDLFGLIESSLAIDTTTLKTQNTNQ